MEEANRDQKALEEMDLLMEEIKKMNPDSVLSAAKATSLERQIAKIFNDVADTTFTPKEILNQNPDHMLGLLDYQREQLNSLKDMLKRVFAARERAEHMPKIHDGVEILNWLVNSYQVKDPKVALTKKDVETLEQKLIMVLKDLCLDLDEKFLSKGLENLNMQK